MYCLLFTTFQYHLQFQCYQFHFQYELEFHLQFTLHKLHDPRYSDFTAIVRNSVANVVFTRWIVLDWHSGKREVWLQYGLIKRAEPSTVKFSSSPSVHPLHSEKGEPNKGQFASSRTNRASIVEHCIVEMRPVLVDSF